MQNEMENFAFLVFLWKFAFDVYVKLFLNFEEFYFFFYLHNKKYISGHTKFSKKDKFF